MTFRPSIPNPPPLALTSKGDGLYREVRTPAHVGIPEVFVGLDHKFIDTEAIWDTGATGTVIDAQLAARMKLPPTGKALVRHAQGEEEVNTYIIDIALPMRVGFREVRVVEGRLGNCGLLIGMDIIATGDMSLTHENGNSVFSFRLPPAQNPIDYVVEINERRARDAAKQHKSSFWTPPPNFKKRKRRKR